MAQTFSGSLKTKRKGDLQSKSPPPAPDTISALTPCPIAAIASSLGLNIPQDALKHDYELSIRSLLLSSPSYASDPRYSGLVHSIQHERSTSESGSAVGSPVKRAVRRSTAELSEAAAGAGLVNGRQIGELIDRAETEFEQTLNQALASADRAFTSLGPLPGAHTVGRLARRTSMKFRDATEASVEVVAEVATSTVIEAQQTLSSPWVLLALGIVTEIVYIVLSVLPLVQKAYPPLKWLLYDFTSATKPFRFLLPDPFVLFTRAFLVPLLNYTFITLGVPLLVSLLISFPTPTSVRAASVGVGGRGGVATRGKAKLAPPNAFTFAVVRLSILVLLQLVFPTSTTVGGYAYGWEAGPFGVGGFGGVGLIGAKGLEGLKGVQLVGAASGVAFTLYDAML